MTSMIGSGAAIGQTSQEPILKVRKLHDDARLPIRMSNEAAGMDIFCYSKTKDGRPSKIMIPSQDLRRISTGICVQLHAHSAFCGVCSRSGMAGQGVWVANQPGILDPDYTGEVIVTLYNSGRQPYWVEHEQRIAQIIPFGFLVNLRIVQTDALQQTERGVAGFGSTGR